MYKLLHVGRRSAAFCALTAIALVGGRAAQAGFVGTDNPADSTPDFGSFADHDDDDTSGKKHRGFNWLSGGFSGSGDSESDGGGGSYYSGGRWCYDPYARCYSTRNRCDVATTWSGPRHEQSVHGHWLGRWDDSPAGRFHQSDDDRVHRGWNWEDGSYFRNKPKGSQDPSWNSPSAGYHHVVWDDPRDERNRAHDEQYGSWTWWDDTHEPRVREGGWPWDSPGYHHPDGNPHNDRTPPGSDPRNWNWGNPRWDDSRDDDHDVDWNHVIGHHGGKPWHGNSGPRGWCYPDRDCSPNRCERYVSCRDRNDDCNWRGCSRGPHHECDWDDCNNWPGCRRDDCNYWVRHCHRHHCGECEPPGPGPHHTPLPSSLTLLLSGAGFAGGWRHWRMTRRRAAMATV